MRSLLIILSFFLTALYAVVDSYGETRDSGHSLYHNISECSFCHTSDYEGKDMTDAHHGGGSVTCMGCHDGVSAMNMAVRADIFGNNLKNSHPVSVEYIEGIAGLRPKTDTVIAIRGAETVNDMLVNGKVECISCHDQHNAGDTSPNPLRLFLRNDNKGSALCYACHDK